MIGETAELGDDVFMYHGVTLGSTSTKKGNGEADIRGHILRVLKYLVLGKTDCTNDKKITKMSYDRNL